MNSIYFDSETTGLDPFKNKITLVQILRDNKIIIDNLKDSASIQKLKDLLESSLVHWS